MNEPATPASPPTNALLRRIAESTGVPDIVDRLAALPGADFTSLMLHVARERAAAVTPATLLQRYRTDRFLGPGAVPFRQVRAAEDVLLAELPPEFELVTLSPLAPLGTHSAIATVDQHKVVSTVRGSEVAADPTNALALDAALRRRADPTSSEIVRLAALQRVVRAQHVEGEGMFAHFAIFGMVSAGRDTGAHRFEVSEIARHVRLHADVLRAAAATTVRFALTRLADDGGPAYASARAALAEIDGVEVVDWDERETGRNYYEGVCFKSYAGVGGELVELGDGGFVDWTRCLVGSQKERCLISGIGVDRLAILVDGSRDA